MPSGTTADAVPAQNIVRPHAIDPASAQIVGPEDDFVTAQQMDTVPITPKRRSRAGTVCFTALGVLLSLGFTLWVKRVVEGFFASGPLWLGWLTLGVSVIALISFLMIIAREALGILWEKTIERLRLTAAEVIEVNNDTQARSLLYKVIALYERDTTTASIQRIRAFDEGIMQASARLALAEREYLTPRDREAKQLVASTVRQVSVVTTLSPRAVIDVVFIIYALARLLRQISSLYGGKPGILGIVRLFRLALTHLAVTTGIAVGDSMAHDILGSSLATWVSARLGEGVLNGTLSARFGLAAIAVCRPLPFIEATPPKLADVIKCLTSKAKEDENNHA